MSAVSDAIAGKGFLVLQAGVVELEKLAEAASPVGLDELLKLLLAIPAVQGLITKGEEAVAQLAGHLADVAVTDLEAAGESVLKAHPALATLWAKVKPVASVVEAKYGPVLMGAIEKLSSQGRLGELEGWLKQAGVL